MAHTYYTRLTLVHPLSVPKLDPRLGVVIAETATTGRFILSDLSWESVVAPNALTTVAYHGSGDMKILEPLGMSLFDYIRAASYEVGIENHLDARFLLEVEILAENYLAEKNTDSPFKYIWPIMLIATEVKGTFSEKGTEYNIKFTHQGGAAQSDLVQPIKEALTVKATNLKDFFKLLQKGLEEREFMYAAARQKYGSKSSPGGDNPAKSDDYHDEYHFILEPRLEKYNFTSKGPADRGVQGSWYNFIPGTTKSWNITMRPGTTIMQQITDVMKSTKEISDLSPGKSKPATADASGSSERSTKNMEDMLGTVYQFFRVETHTVYKSYDPIRARYAVKHVFLIYMADQPNMYQYPDEIDLLNKLSNRDKVELKLKYYIQEGLLQKIYYYNYTGLNTDILKVDLQFNQTFTDNAYSQKTLHEPTKFFEASNIKKANPADVSFTLPLYEENDFAPVYECLRELNSNNGLKQFDLYIQMPNDLYYINKCVVKSGSFLIERDKPLRLQIQAQGSQLKRYGSTEGAKRTSAFNSLTRSSTKTHQVFTDHLEASVEGTSLDCLFSVSAELQNNIEWVENKTLNKSIDLDTSDFSHFNLVDTTSTYTPAAAASQNDSVGQYIGSAPISPDRDIYIGSVTWAADRSYFDIGIDLNANSLVNEVYYKLYFDSNKITTQSITKHMDNGSFASLTFENISDNTFSAGYDKRNLVDYSAINSDMPTEGGSAVTLPYTMFTYRFNVVGGATGATSFLWDVNNSTSSPITTGGGDTFSINITSTSAEPSHLSINAATGVVTFNNGGNSTKSNYSYRVEAISSTGAVLESTNYTISSTGSLSNSDTVATAVYTGPVSDGTIFPEKALVKDRKFTGSVGQYVTDSTSHKYVQTHKTGVPIVIKTGKDSTTGFQFNIGQCTFTNRNTVADAFTQSFDWKMNDAGSNTISSIIKINNA